MTNNTPVKPRPGRPARQASAIPELEQDLQNLEDELEEQEAEAEATGAPLPKRAPAQSQSVRERPIESRTTLNHYANEENNLAVEIGGMKFRRRRAGLDHSVTRTIDIPEELKNSELHYRVVNDYKGKVQRAKDLGYEIVDPASFGQGKEIPTKWRVGTKEDGSDLYAVLMATPKQWFEERQNLAEQERIDREDGMFNAPQDESGKKLGNEFYINEMTKRS